jgi:glycosyltransferase involved in cell wall biosynthesis
MLRCVARPLVTVVIPTHGRRGFLHRAIESVLGQTIGDLEVVVVDDGSETPAEVPDDPRIRLVRLDVNRGVAGALTAGARGARGRWIAHLDDDDVFLPHMLEVSLEAQSANTRLPRPLAVLSGIEVVDSTGKVLQQRLPPTRPRGSHFSLEPLEGGYAYETRITMVVERELLERVGYWDERFRSRARHELFLRLNPVCSILGLPVVTYRQLQHTGYRVSTDAQLKHESFKLLEQKHRGLFEAHPQRYAHYLVRDAARLVALGRRTEAAATLARAVRLSPATTTARLLRLVAARVSRAL